MHRTHRLVVPLALALAGCPAEPANEAPAFSITAPSEGALYTAGHAVELVGVVDDADDVPETLRISWSADGAVVCADQVPQPDGRSMCTWVAELGDGNIEAVVTDPDGLTGSATLTVQVQAPNNDPSCSFDSPSSGSVFGPSDTITLEGTATDPDDDALQVVFSSSLDKEIGATEPDAAGGVSLEVGPLSQGEHTLTMVVTDPHGASCEGSVELTVIPDDTGDPDTGSIDPDPDTGGPSPE